MWVQGKTNRVPKQGGIQIAFAEAQNPDIAKTNFVEGRRAWRSQNAIYEGGSNEAFYEATL